MHRNKVDYERVYVHKCTHKVEMTLYLSRPNEVNKPTTRSVLHTMEKDTIIFNPSTNVNGKGKKSQCIVHRLIDMEACSQVMKEMMIEYE